MYLFLGTGTFISLYVEICEHSIFSIIEQPYLRGPWKFVFKNMPGKGINWA